MMISCQTRASSRRAPLRFATLLTRTVLEIYALCAEPSTNSAFSSLSKSITYFFAIANSFQAFGEFYLSKLFDEILG